MKKVSLTDIALAAGVSISTVSRIVNNSAGIAEKTRNHVLQIMREQGYHPRHFSGGVGSRPSRMVTLVITEHEANIFENPFFIMAMKGANACARERHFHVMVSFCESEGEQYNYLEELVSANWTDGVVLFSVEQQDPSIEYLRGKEFPFSVIGRPDKPSETLWVDNDNFQAIYTLVSDLIDRGCRSIAFIGTKWSRRYTLDRYEGYLQALRSRGIEIQKQLCSPRTEAGEADKSQSSEELGYLYTDEILRAEQPDAVVATDDFLAFGALRALSEADIQNIPVYGFNNSIRGRYQHPSLASVDIHPEQLGYQATRVLIDSIQDSRSEAAHQIVDTSVIHRSTG
ncbi:MAG TPA: LacI family DNA-binding transcriptional regulator [Clostridia bacterium]|nr:LacI family DNA-binding transcriptional regulator [Clostridia bacterium]